MRQQTRLAARLVFARSKLRDLAMTRLGEVSRELFETEEELESRRTKFLSDSRSQLLSAPNARSLWMVERQSAAQRSWIGMREQRLASLQILHEERRQDLIRASSQLRAAERVHDRMARELVRTEDRREQSAIDDRSAVERATKRRGPNDDPRN